LKHEFNIKEFQDYEAGEIFAIISYIYRTSEYMSDDFDRKFPSSTKFKNHYADLLNNEGSFLLVVNFEDKPIGYLLVEANSASHLRHTATLNMGIVENLRGKGVGKLLLKQAITRAKYEGVVEIIYLMVRSDHDSAVQLYKSLGFDVLAKLEKDTKVEGKYFDGLMMRKFI